MALFVVSIGGSLIAPKTGIDIEYLQSLRRFILKRVKCGDRFVLISGGGQIARAYQNAARDVVGLTRDDLDWLGIHSTRLNAHLLRTILRDVACPVISKDPSRIRKTKLPVQVAAGWKPGWSTDYVAVRIAKRLKANMVLNLSDIDGVYDKDPRKFKNAKLVERISWPDFREMVGSEWNPGAHVPFDPVASRLAHTSHIPVVVASGRDFKNIARILDGKLFIGTKIE
ncbi:MAG: UMP kinase [Patescibacteria group bacterium]